MAWRAERLRKMVELPYSSLLAVMLHWPTFILVLAWNWLQRHEITLETHLFKKVCQLCPLATKLLLANNILNFHANQFSYSKPNYWRGCRLCNIFGIRLILAGKLARQSVDMWLTYVWHGVLRSPPACPTAGGLRRTPCCFHYITLNCKLKWVFNRMVSYISNEYPNRNFTTVNLATRKMLAG